MKPILIIFFGSFIFSNAIGQVPVEVTPTIQKKIIQNIEKEIPRFKQQLEKEKASLPEIEFTLDTFRVERFIQEYIKLDYGDFGMRDASYKAADRYDSLLNKYYKKLLKVLKGEDKKILIQSQKSWLAFRNNEIKLVELISKDQYSGGGTMQQLTESSMYMDLIKNRTIAIFEHYTRATQGY